MLFCIILFSGAYFAGFSDLESKKNLFFDISLGLSLPVSQLISTGDAWKLEIVGVQSE